jgi:hypothetical protein
MAVLYTKEEVLEKIKEYKDLTDAMGKDDEVCLNCGAIYKIDSRYGRSCYCDRDD